MQPRRTGSKAVRKRLAISIALLLLPTGTSTQARLTVEIAGGRVSLNAQDVSIRDVLSKWAQVGGVTVVNADKLTDIHVTLQLTDVAESDALAALLRNANGYILARRPYDDDRGAASIDRIVIIPGSAPPQAAGSVPSSVPMPEAAARIVELPEQGAHSAETPATEDVIPSQVQEVDDVPDLQADRSFERTTAPRRNPPPVGPFGQPLGVVTGPGGANMPTTDATNADDLSRYEGMLRQEGSAPHAVEVGPNPFGITNGTLSPGPSDGADTKTPSGQSPTAAPVGRRNPR